MPVLAPGIAIVKVAAVAINPSDAKFLDYSPAPGAVHGTDFSGTIVTLGDETVVSGRFA
ncbi:putative polyketide enoylreductase, partial [Seiridium unicorne]